MRKFKLDLYKDDGSNAEIAHGTNTTFTGSDYTYTGNWKVKLTSDGTLTIFDTGSADTIDIFLVGGGGKGGSGASYVAQSSRGGSGGGGGSLTTVSKFPAVIGTGYTIDIGAAASNTYWKLGSTVYFGANKGGDGCKPSYSGGWSSCTGAGGSAYSHTDNRGAASINATAGANGGKGGSRQTGRDGTYEFHGTSGTMYGAGGGSGGGGDSTGTGGGHDSGFAGGLSGGGKGGSGCDYCNNGSGWTCCGTGKGSSGAANSGAGGGGGGGSSW